MWIIRNVDILVRFQFLTEARMKMTVFWKEETDRRFRGAHCLHHEGDDQSNDVGGKHLKNVGQISRDYASNISEDTYGAPYCNKQDQHL